MIMIDLENSSKMPGAVNQACKSPYHSEGESVEDDCSVIIDSCSDLQSNYTNTSIVKLTKKHHDVKSGQDSITDTGEETFSMASGHSSSQNFSYILG